MVTDKFIFFSAGVGLSQNVDKINVSEIIPNKGKIGIVSNIINQIIERNQNCNMIKDIAKLPLDFAVSTDNLLLYIDDMVNFPKNTDLNSIPSASMKLESSIFTYASKNNFLED